MKALKKGDFLKIFNPAINSTYIITSIDLNTTYTVIIV